MRLRGIRVQLVSYFLALILLPLVSFAAYSFWQVYHFNPENFTQLVFILSGAFAVTVILALLLSFNLSEKFTAPIEAITTAARRIASGRLSERVHVRAGNEIDYLALALNHLASRLEEKVDEISAEKQKLQLILEYMDNAVMLFDNFGFLAEANRSAFQWFDLSLSMVGQHNIKVLGNSQLDSAIRESLQTGQIQQQTFRTNFKGVKKIFQVSLVALPRKENAPAGVLTVFHDITSLQLIQERQADFVANASHELATPLTAIRGFAETLVNGAADNPEDSRRFAAIILSESERMQRLVADLLQLARIDSANYRQQLHSAPTQVQPLLESIVRELSPLWTQKQLCLSLDLPDEPLWVLSAPDPLKQVFVNLIDNAIKYTPDQGFVRVSASPLGDRVQFTVQDSGIGIPAEDLPRIFDRFYRIDRARSRSIAGTGLGLAIARQIIDSLGGRIEVESKPDAGTTFRLFLPGVPPEQLNRISESPPHG